MTKKNNEVQEYVPRIEHLSEKCRQCNKRLDLVVKDMKPELNIVTFHMKCYQEWFKEVREYGRRQGAREGIEDED